MSVAEEPSCSICFEVYDIYAYGRCRHLLCLECALKMRILVKEDKCAICREVCPHLYANSAPFLWESNFKTLPGVDKLVCANLYARRNILAKAKKIISPVCKECGSVSSDITTLKNHYSRNHGLSFCFLCADHHKIFPKDYATFSSKELRLHLLTHQKCLICQSMFLNEVHLSSHVKKEHFSCDVCDTLKKVSYFSTLSQLKDHMAANHLMCEYGECAFIRLTGFSNKADYNLHLIKDHSSSFTKEQKKAMATLDISDLYNTFSDTATQNATESSLRHQTLHSSNRAGNESGVDIISTVNQMLNKEKPHSHLSLDLNDYNFPHLNGSYVGVEAEIPKQISNTRPKKTKQAPVLRENLPELLKNEEAFPALQMAAPVIFARNQNKNLKPVPQSSRGTLNDARPNSMVHKKPLPASKMEHTNPGLISFENCTIIKNKKKRKQQTGSKTVEKKEGGNAAGKLPSDTKTLDRMSSKSGTACDSKLQKKDSSPKVPAESFNSRNANNEASRKPPNQRINNQKVISSVNTPETVKSDSAKADLNGLDSKKSKVIGGRTNSTSNGTGCKTNNGNTKVFVDLEGKPTEGSSNVSEKNSKSVGNTVPLTDIIRKACAGNENLLRSFMVLCKKFIDDTITATQFEADSLKIFKNKYDFHNLIPRLAAELPIRRKAIELNNLLKK